MNKEIITKGLALLKYTYPNTFKDYSKEDTEMMIIVWLDAFNGDDPKIFEQAIKRIMKQSKWCPSIAEIKQEMALITNPILQLNADEEWEKVLLAVRKYGSYRVGEAIETLNPFTANIVKQVGFTRICLSENIQWEHKEFIELFNTNKKRNEIALSLPESQMTLSEISRMAKLKEEERLLLNADTMSDM